MSDKFSQLTPEWKAAVLIVLFGVLQSVYNIFIPLYLDEAYYWVWSLEPQWSYYDHPAMVAWIMYPFSIMGTEVFLVRLPTVICMSVTIFYIFRLTLDIAGEKAAWVVALVFAVLPVTQMGYVFITPDSPLVMFWAMGQYYVYMALKKGRTAYFIFAGATVGCMVLSKYTAVLFPSAVFVFLILRRREVFRDPRLWLAAFTALLLTLPIIWWNYSNDWASLAFQYRHGTAEEFRFVGADFFVFVLGSLFLIPTPVLSFILLRYIFNPSRWFRNDSRFYLICLTLVPLLFFFYKGLFKKMELNWVIVAFIAGSVLLGIAACEYKMKKTLIAGITLAALLSVILKLSPFLPLPPSLNIADRLLGYEELCRYVSEEIEDADAVFSDHLTTASMLRFYLKDHRRVYIPVISRVSQYTIWDKAPDVDISSMNGVYIGGRDARIELESIFGKVVPLGFFLTKPENGTLKGFYIYRCYAKK